MGNIYNQWLAYFHTNQNACDMDAHIGKPDHRHSLDYTSVFSQRFLQINMDLPFFPFKMNVRVYPIEWPGVPKPFWFISTSFCQQCLAHARKTTTIPH